MDKSSRILFIKQAENSFVSRFLLNCSVVIQHNWLLYIRFCCYCIKLYRNDGELWFKKGCFMWLLYVFRRQTHLCLKLVWKFFLFDLYIQRWWMKQKRRGVELQLRPLDLKYVSVETDGGGMRVDSLERAMSKWSPADALNPTSDIPKLIYLQPSSSNPTGVAIAPDRRLAILQVNNSLLTPRPAPSHKPARYFRLLRNTICLLSKTIRITIWTLRRFVDLFSALLKMVYLTGISAQFSVTGHRRSRVTVGFIFQDFVFRVSSCRISCE